MNPAKFNMYPSPSMPLDLGNMDMGMDMGMDMDTTAMKMPKRKVYSTG
jgi:hypothetical protein